MLRFTFPLVIISGHHCTICRAYLAMAFLHIFLGNTVSSHGGQPCFDHGTIQLEYELSTGPALPSIYVCIADGPPQKLPCRRVNRRLYVIVCQGLFVQRPVNPRQGTRSDW